MLGHLRGWGWILLGAFAASQWGEGAGVFTILVCFFYLLPSDE